MHLFCHFFPASYRHINFFSGRFFMLLFRFRMKSSRCLYQISRQILTRPPPPVQNTLDSPGAAPSCLAWSRESWRRRQQKKSDEDKKQFSAAWSAGLFPTFGLLKKIGSEEEEEDDEGQTVESKLIYQIKLGMYAHKVIELKRLHWKEPTSRPVGVSICGFRRIQPVLA